MEIEKKFLIQTLPDLNTATAVKHIEQGYISTSPVIRIRKSNDLHFLTCKGKGLMAREEFELPLEPEEYDTLKAKVDGQMIIKKRYLIPFDSHTIELDIFEGFFQGLMVAEVEFNTLKEAECFVPPSWFGKEVTMDKRYHNSQLSAMHKSEEISDLLANP